MTHTHRGGRFWNRRGLLLLPCAVIGVLLATTGASCNTTSGSSGINNQPAATSSGSASSSGSVSSSATAAPVAHVGDSVVVAGNNNEQLTVQLVKIIDPASGADQFTTADQGKHFIAIQFRLSNSGTVTYTDSPDNDAKVLDAQGQSFSPDFSDTNAGPAFAGNQVIIAG